MAFATRSLPVPDSPCSNTEATSLSATFAARPSIFFIAADSPMIWRKLNSLSRKISDLCGEAQHLLHRRRLTDDLAEIEFPFPFLSYLRNFTSEIPRFDRITDCDAKFFEIDRLPDEVVSATAKS